MIDRLLADLEKSLDNDCYFAALSLALMFPDICGRAEYPDLNTSSKKRYIQWYDEYIGRYEKPPKESDEELDMPYLSGEVVYQLRCSFLHQGKPDVDKENIKAAENKINHFTLVTEKKKKYNAYCDTASVRNAQAPSIEERSYRVNLRRFCFIMSQAVKSYYKSNKNKFGFIHCNIVDWDDEIESISLFNPISNLFQEVQPCPTSIQEKSDSSRTSKHPS